MKKIHSISDLGAFPRAFHFLIRAAFSPALVSILALQTSHAGIDAQLVATGFDNPLCLVAPPGDTSRLFVVEQTGKIKIIKLASRTVNATPFLDVSSEITSEG